MKYHEMTIRTQIGDKFLLIGRLDCLGYIVYRMHGEELAHHNGYWSKSSAEKFIKHQPVWFLGKYPVFR